MTDTTPSATVDGDLWVARRDEELRARFEHLRGLNSAWALLAPFGLGTAGGHIVETARVVSAELERLASQAFEDRARESLPKLDKLLDAVESEMRALAFHVPIGQLRSTLPAKLPGERRGVLDLLDLMLGDGFDGDESIANRFSAIDYLITLLCTGGAEGDGTVLVDPVGLSPRLHDLSERASADEDPRLGEIEAEFYAAAPVDPAAARDEVQLRAMRTRKRELGARFFAPGVLRAIVAYNAALSRCIGIGVEDSRDWGSLAAQSERPGADVSVFETEVLPRLGESLRRRAKGSGPTTGAIDRVAWCLDLDSLDEAEKKAVLAPSVGRPGDLAGTTILVGLLCRSAPVLEGEFPAIGISPERLHSEWVRELDETLKREVNAGITGDAYQQSRILSELRTRFLHASMSDVHRDRRRRAPRTEAPSLERVEREARQLAGAALEKAGSEPEGAAATDWKNWRLWPWERVARVAGGVAVVGLAGWMLLPLLFGGELDRLSGAELERVSPYLARGARNGEGRGPAFVGTIDDDWSELSADARSAAATRLVEALRAQGVREVMVYDGERRLRIQALGGQPVRIVPASKP